MQGEARAHTRLSTALTRLTGLSGISPELIGGFPVRLQPLCIFLVVAMQARFVPCRGKGVQAGLKMTAQREMLCV